MDLNRHRVKIHVTWYILSIYYFANMIVKNGDYRFLIENISDKKKNFKYL